MAMCYFVSTPADDTDLPAERAALSTICRFLLWWRGLHKARFGDARHELYKEARKSRGRLAGIMYNIGLPFFMIAVQACVKKGYQITAKYVWFT